MVKLEGALIQSKQGLLNKLIQHQGIYFFKAFSLVVENLWHEESWVVGTWQVEVGEPQLLLKLQLSFLV